MKLKINKQMSMHEFLIENDLLAQLVTKRKYINIYVCMYIY